MKKSRGILGLALCAALAFAPALAEAKAGGGMSGGSRGTRSYNTAPATPTAPQAKPVERSATSPNQQRQQQAQPSAAPQAQPSFFQRNPFMAGLMGGLLGAGIGAMLFGGGFFPSGFAGALGLLLQLALIGGLVYLGLRIWRSRQADSQRPAYAYAGLTNEPQQRSPLDVRPLDVATGRVGEAPAPTGAQDDVGIQPADFEEFQRLLGEIQKAWSAGDVAALRRHVTPEMLSYFSEQLSENASAGIENHVDDVLLQQGDLAESWREGNIDYATVAMRWSAKDYTVRIDSGAVVDGSKTERSDATEVWTFMRTSGGRWLLSAIQQVEAVA